MARDMKDKALQDQKARDKFKTHKGEFMPVTEENLRGMKIEQYTEYKDDEETSEGRKDE
ncbi:hypothetical protein [Luxibacter massiliensis]|uniref:hypothetical protein n=1 Tax=Luxibacter massiliensis TaxID=2219695 RepID=UPI0013DF1F50|nr:hypothetical protein [Luxibacter massiliensis]